MTASKFYDWRERYGSQSLTAVQDVQPQGGEVHAAFHQLAQQAAHQRRAFCRALAQPQHRFAPIAANTKGYDHLPVFKRCAVDDYGAQPQLTQRTLRQRLHFFVPHAPLRRPATLEPLVAAQPLLAPVRRAESRTADRRLLPVYHPIAFLLSPAVCPSSFVLLMVLAGQMLDFFFHHRLH